MPFKIINFEISNLLFSLYKVDSLIKVSIFFGLSSIIFSKNFLASLYFSSLTRTEIK